MALTSRNLDQIVLLVCIVFGSILIVVSGSSFKKINNNCKKPVVRKGMTIMMTLGAVMVTIPVTYLACHFASDCGDEGLGHPTIKGSIYIVFLFLLALFMAILSGLMLKAIKEDEKNCGGKEVQGNITILIVASTLAGLSILGIFLYKYRYLFGIDT